MSAQLCRVCKKRSARQRPPKHEDPSVEEALVEIRKKSEGMCSECAATASRARLDQNMAYLKEKLSLGQCCIKNCTEPRTDTGRCAGHQAMFDALD